MSTIKEEYFTLKTGNKLVLRTAIVKDSAAIIKLMRDIIKEGPYTLAEPDEYRSTAKSEAKRI